MKKLSLKTAVVLALVFYALEINSQVPGYMGKRLSVGYGFYINPAFTAAIIGYGESAFNTQHEAFLEYTTGKKFTLGFSARLYRSTYENTAMVDITPNSNSSTSYQLDDHPSGNYKINGVNYCLYGKFFKSNYLAPWGRYFTLGISINKYRTTYNPSQMRVLNSETFYTQNGAVIQRQYFSNFGPTKQSFVLPDIMFGNGKNRIFNDKITLDYGYNINVVAMTLVLLDAFDEHDAYSYDYIEVTSRSRTRGITRFNFYLKVGYLF